jgi:hypothetical protein
MPVKNVSTTLPSTDFGMEAEKIARNRKMAELLQQQALEPTKGEMVSGYYVAPSWTQGAAKMFQAYSGRKGQEAADEQTKDLGNRRTQALIDGLMGYQKSITGTPDQQVESKALVNPDGSPQMVTVKGQPANRQEAMIQLLRSGVPELQQMGMSALTAKPENNFSKIDPKDYTQQSIAKFAASQNFADLVPVRKAEVFGDKVVNPYDQSLVGTNVQKTPEGFVRGPDGQLAVDPNWLAAKKSIAHSGATNVSVNTAQKPFLNEIGKGVGEAVTNAYTGAQSAAQTLNNVNQIREGLKSAITGPGANVRIKLAQIGDTLGVAGKDNAEKLQNTRAVIQGLARQELSAAGQMKGQGQITESERGILRRAESGDIAELTKPEIDTLLNALDKTANYRINLHKNNMQRLRQDPNAAGVVDYMNVEPPQPSQPAPAAPGGWGIKRLP